MDDLDNLPSPTSASKKPYLLPRSLMHHHHHHHCLIKAKDEHLAIKPLWKHRADEPKHPKVILFSTSLHSTIHAILHGFHIVVDEWDMSMESR